MTDTKKLADLLFPDVRETPQQLMESTYPARQLPQGAQVTRFAPSPTGFLHIGGVFASMAAERTAHTSRGVCILRIEDTDKKREMDDGVSIIVNGLSDFGIRFDEGVHADGSESGGYGPYIQSKRRYPYHVFCKDLVEKGLAYPCFCTAERISEIREEQEKAGVTPGYWGEYTQTCRERSLEEIEELIKQGTPYVVRLRSPGKPGGRVKFKDIIRGEIEMEENFVDVVLLKSDGIPTYHFAHIVDDTLMGVTTVTRGEEWIASAPIHLQLFWLCGLKAPKYAHVPSIMKEDNGGKRKLSKRKDPEAAVSYFVEEGYPADAVMEYLLTIANSNFEDWRKQNKTAHYTAFPFALNKMSPSGALFDLSKLQSAAGTVISLMSAEQVLDSVLEWSERYDSELFEVLSADKAKALSIFSIDRGGSKPRKDIAKWNEVRAYISYFYDELNQAEGESVEMSAEDQKAILTKYLTVYDPQHNKDEWFGAIKGMCESVGFCSDVKAYKADPAGYKGHVGDVSSVIRVAVPGRKNTPDLCAIMNVLGKDKITERINEYLERI
ncbi:MAG: glutamate--tRNA ligase [Clostridia bacterium]|nr:glutamate--tRNA ligase [Clostridia bacterium]